MQEQLDKELSLAERYRSLTMSFHDRPVVARRNTVPALISLMASSSPVVRRVAVESIALLCDHPQNPFFLLSETQLLAALQEEADYLIEQYPDSELVDDVVVLERGTLDIILTLIDILEDAAANGVTSETECSPQARPTQRHSGRLNRRGTSERADTSVSRHSSRWWSWWPYVTQMWNRSLTSLYAWCIHAANKALRGRTWWFTTRQPSSDCAPSQ